MRKGCLAAPRTTTLEQFLATLAPFAQPIGPEDLEVLFIYFLETLAFEHLNQSHLGELTQLHREIILAGKQNSFFARLDEWCESEARHEGELINIRGRLQEIATLYTTVERHLQEHKLLSQADRESKLVSNAIKAVDGGLLRDQGEVLFIGIVTVQEHWLELIKLLAREPNVSFWLPTPVVEGLSEAPLNKIIHALQPKKVAGTSPPKQSSRVPNQIRCLAAQSPVDEVSQAMLIAKSAIAQGIAPHRVAILVTDERAYRAYVHEFAKQHFGDDYNNALARSFDQSSLGQWMMLVIGWLEKPSVNNIISLLAHPVSQRHMKAICTTSSIDLKPSELLLWLARQGDKVLTNARAANDSNATQHETLFASLIAPLQQLRRQKSTVMQDWHLIWIRFISHWLSDPTTEDRDGFSTLQTAMQKNQMLQIELTGASYQVWLKALLKGLEQRSIGEPLAGVQILRFAEARFLPLDLAIVVGCHEGQLPGALPRDTLVDDYLKRQGGLQGWQGVEEMEEQNFRLLLARLPMTVLVYSRQCLGQERSRSRFVEEVLAANPNAMMRRVSSDLNQDNHSIDDYLMNRKNLALEMHGKCYDPSLLSRKPISATKLESLIRCPYRFALSVSGCSDQSLLVESYEASIQGQWLHEVIATFLGDKHRGLFDAPWKDQKGWVDAATRVLTQISLELAPIKDAEDPVILQLIHYSWPRFARFLWQLYQGDLNKHRASLGQEFKFGRGQDQQTPDSLMVGPRHWQVTGAIDSLHSIANGQFIIDFKLRNAAKEVEVREARAPQLAFYAAVIAEKYDRLPLERLAVGYWSILKGELQLCISGEELRPAMEQSHLISSKNKKAGLADVVAALRSMWQWRLDDIEQNASFLPDNSDCKFCSFQGICRRDDPLFRDKFHNANRLAHKDHQR